MTKPHEILRKIGTCIPIALDAARTDTWNVCIVTQHTKHVQTDISLLHLYLVMITLHLHQADVTQCIAVNELLVVSKRQDKISHNIKSKASSQKKTCRLG